MTTTFLSNESLWQNLTGRTKSARHVDAAIAYFGRGGSNLFPLKRGHRLIVNMSLTTAKAGATDPREIERLMRRGVKVFTRRNLHSKLAVFDREAIVGSSNVSRQSNEVLDEAGILTDDPVTVARARDYISRLCTEPVTQEYLDHSKKLYRPPRFAGRNGSSPSQGRVSHAKLWMVNLRADYDVPESEYERYAEGTRKARDLLKDGTRTKLWSFHWPSKPKMADELELGDWIIEVSRYKDKSAKVWPPARFLMLDRYVRDSRCGRQRYVFHLEAPGRAQAITWSDFRRLTRSALPPSDYRKPRTRPIRDVTLADSVLRLWTPGGRVARRRGGLRATRTVESL